MTTKLDQPLKREIVINGDPFIVTLASEGSSSSARPA
jgi:hypothetical protein